MIEEQKNNSTDKKEKNALAVLVLAVFMDLLGFTIVIPLLPFWTLDLGASDYVYGLFFAIYSFFQFIWSPIWGKLSDKYGRRPIILSGLTGTFLSFLMLLLAATILNSLVIILISRIIGGIFTAATLPTSYAYISDSVEAQKQTKSYGLIGASMGLAYVIGPALGGTLTVAGKLILNGSSGYWFPIALALAFATINLVFGIKNLPESRTEEVIEAIKKKSEQKRQRFQTMRVLKENPKILILILLFTLANYAFSSLDAVLAIFGKEKFNMDEFLTGIIFMCAGIVMIVTQGGLVGPLAKKFKGTKLIIAGFALMTIAFWVVGLADSFSILLLLTVPICFGLSIAQPSANGLLSQEMPLDKRGEILGLNESFKSGSRILGPIIASSLLVLDLAIPWSFTAIVLCSGVLLAFILNYSSKYSNLSSIARKNEAISG